MKRIIVTLSVIMSLVISCMAGLTFEQVTVNALVGYANPTDVRELPVNYTDNIDVSSIGHSITEDIIGDYGKENIPYTVITYNYKFSVDTSSYIRIRGNMNTDTSGWSRYKVYLSTSLGDRSMLISENSSDGNNAMDFQSALESGSYYISFVVSDESIFKSSVPDDAYLSIQLSAQRVYRTSTNTGATVSDAIPVNNGKAVGYITGVTSAGTFSVNAAAQYFKVSVPKKSKLSLQATVQRFANLDTTMGTTAQLLTKSGKILGTYSSASGSNSVDATLKSVNKGTYYLKVTYPRFCQINVSTKTTPYISSPKISMTSKGKKVKITKALAGAKVKIKWGKKTITKKTNKKGTVTIKLPSYKKKKKVKITLSKSGYISWSKNYTVKKK